MQRIWRHSQKEQKSYEIYVSKTRVCLRTQILLSYCFGSNENYVYELQASRPWLSRQDVLFDFVVIIYGNAWLRPCSIKEAALKIMRVLCHLAFVRFLWTMMIIFDFDIRCLCNENLRIDSFCVQRTQMALFTFFELIRNTLKALLQNTLTKCSENVRAIDNRISDRLCAVSLHPRAKCALPQKSVVRPFQNLPRVSSPPECHPRVTHPMCQNDGCLLLLETPDSGCNRCLHCAFKDLPTPEGIALELAV